MVVNDELVELSQIKEITNQYFEVFRDFFRDVAKIQIKYGFVSLWLEDLSDIGDLRDMLSNNSNSEIGDFFKFYMDYVYLVRTAQNIRNIAESEMDSLGKLIGLEKDEIEKWKNLQRERVALESNEE